MRDDEAREVRHVKARALGAQVRHKRLELAKTKLPFPLLGVGAHERLGPVSAHLQAKALERPLELFDVERARLSEVTLVEDLLELLIRERDLEEVRYILISIYLVNIILYFIGG